MNRYGLRKARRMLVAALGLIATTNPGGAKQFQPELAQWFKGKQLVYILEDNDDAGREHTRKIIAALADIVPNIAVVAFPELPEKGDVSDWLALGGNKKLLIARAKQAHKQSGGQQLELESICAANVTMTAVEWLWPNRFALGKLGLIVGLPEEGKRSDSLLHRRPNHQNGGRYLAVWRRSCTER